jgi:SET domain-containing protein
VTIFGADKPDHPCLCGIEALRDIKPGEELFIDYVDPNKSREDREEALHFQYGIHHE